MSQLSFTQKWSSCATLSDVPCTIKRYIYWKIISLSRGRSHTTGGIFFNLYPSKDLSVVIFMCALLESFLYDIYLYIIIINIQLPSREGWPKTLARIETRKAYLGESKGNQQPANHFSNLKNTPSWNTGKIDLAIAIVFIAFKDLLVCVLISMVISCFYDNLYYKIYFRINFRYAYWH